MGKFLEPEQPVQRVIANLGRDQPGLTRDRQYGLGRIGLRDYLVVDTAGFDPVARDGIMGLAQRLRERLARRAKP